MVTEKFTTLDYALDLFITADYFGVEYVKKEATVIMDKRLSGLIYLKSDDDLEKPILHSGARDSFFRAARLAYGSAPTFEMMRSPLERFLRSTDFLLTKDTRFMQELRDIPEFALAIIDMMGSYLIDKMRSRCNTSCGPCSSCGIPVLKFAETWVAVVREAHGRRPKRKIELRGFCSKCTKNNE